LAFLSCCFSVSKVTPMSLLITDMPNGDINLYNIPNTKCSIPTWGLEGKREMVYYKYQT